MSLSPPTYEDLDLDSRIRLDEVIRTFEIAFLANPATRLEEFLDTAREGEAPAEPLASTARQEPRPPGRHEQAVLLLELLCVELECRRRRGQVPMVEEYLRRLPDEAETIRAAFGAPRDGLVGSRLGKYQLTRFIGRGGMGTVYAATDTVVDRQVAVKILSGSLARDARSQEYLLREAQLVGKLLHPNIVTLFEAGEVDGVCYLVLEHVSGGSAAASLRQNGPFDWVIASRIILDVCQGLAAAHAVGLIHRDIKPGNILLLEPESGSSTSSRSKPPLAKLTDFGLARSPAPAAVDRECVGTPGYMAPEQAVSGASNITTDIYSLGATYSALLTGSPPFQARTLAELLEAHRTAPIPDVRKANSAIPEACARIVRRCLAKSPDQRYPTVEQLIADLDSLLASEGRTRLSRRSLILALTGLAAGIVGVTVGSVAVWIAASPNGRTLSSSTTAGPWEPLFNGRDLTGWQTRDVQGVITPDTDTIFAVKEIDGQATVWTSGRDYQFFLATVQEYENYHLNLEYQWLPPGRSGPNSGIHYHCHFDRPSFLGHEFDLKPPDTGRFHSNRGSTRIDLGVLHQGRIIPGSTVMPDSPLQHNWEYGPGKWNRLDLVCVRDSVLHVLNSRVMLALTRSRFVVGKKETPLTRGRIMLQSFHGTIAFRRIRIRSVEGIPPEFLSANGE